MILLGERFRGLEAAYGHRKIVKNILNCTIHKVCAVPVHFNMQSNYIATTPCLVLLPKSFISGKLKVSIEALLLLFD